MGNTEAIYVAEKEHSINYRFTKKVGNIHQKYRILNFHLFIFSPKVCCRFDLAFQLNQKEANN